MPFIKVRTFLLMVCCLLVNSVISFELLTASVVGLGSFLYHKTYCQLKECCTESEIPGDIDKLERLLNERVYGQHLAQDIVIHSLRAHWNKDYKPQKALTLSFHGWPGGGKNYIANFIKESLFKFGSKSNHVHHFIGRIHFPLVEKIQEYQENLYNWIKGNVTKCAKQLFIFDEVNKMPPNLLNVIKPMIDYNNDVERIDYRETIFIFLSNTGESLITEKMLQLWKDGYRRKEVELKHFESLIIKGAFNEEGGFHHSDTIKSNLIDHYIPFLPLEYEHIKLCIIDQFRLKGVNNPSEDHINLVLDFVEWGPSPNNLYSKTGCKRLSQKVGLIIQQNKLRN